MIYGEELCLTLYIFVKNLQKIMPDEGQKLLSEDLRFSTLMQMVFSRIGEVEFEYLTTTVWALGICVAGYGMEIEPEYKLRLLSIINQKEFPDYTYSSLPTLAFSLSCFFNEDMNQLVTDTIEKISKVYSKLQFLPIISH